MELVQAKLNTIRISAHKVRPVIRLVVGKKVNDATAILDSVPKKVSPILIKLINSAAANAVNNKAMNAEKLYIHNILCGEGMTMKRISTRAKGSADTIKKRTCHLTVQLAAKK